MRKKNTFCIFKHTFYLKDNLFSNFNTNLDNNHKNCIYILQIKLGTYYKIIFPSCLNNLLIEMNSYDS